RGGVAICRGLAAGGYRAHVRALEGRPVSDAVLTDLLRRFDVSDLDLRRRLRDQSHGMKQKIGIIQALMTHAPVVILDEPTAGLDPLMVQAFRDTVAELQQRGDTTVFLSSHVLTEVETTCDRIGLVRGGRIVTAGPIEALKRAAPRRVTVSFAAPVTQTIAIPEIAVREQTPPRWELDVRGPLGPLVEQLAGLPVLDMQVEPFKLEDYVARFY